MGEEAHCTVRYGEATFELGPKAERWAERIRNPKSLLDKLGVKPESSHSFSSCARTGTSG